LSPPPPNEALRDLAALLGDEATREIVGLFLSDFPASIRSLRGCSRDDQMRIAHGLRSSALHMGATGLSRRMGAIEDLLAVPGGTLDPHDLEVAAAEFEAFADELRKYAGA
jgi:hypothetical protein